MMIDEGIGSLLAGAAAGQREGAGVRAGGEEGEELL
jgi:hypothetical protein